MTRRFDGKTILVVGGNAGIGLAAAEAFTAEGGRVAITGRNAESLNAAKDRLGVLAFRADIADLEASAAAIASAAEGLGGIDILFLNAGVGGFAAVPAVTPAFWDEVHNVNLRGAFFACQAALPHMRDHGAIVLTGSIGAVLPLPGNIAYAAAKAGMRAMARILGAELLPRRIRVNMVSPGPTDTEIFKRDATPEQIAAMREMLSSKVPIGRMGSAMEIAEAVLFLSSDAARFVNGVDLYVDGGCVELG